MARKKESRNGHAFHPIMRKGGVHEKSNKAKRAAAKRGTNRKVREWFGRSFSPFITFAFVFGYVVFP
jgi:hypothetical protein